MRYLTISIFIMLTLSCTATYQQIDVNEAPPFKLSPNGHVLIATPEDGIYGETTYRKSGGMTSQAIKAAFSRHTHYVKVTSSCKSIENCLVEARTRNSTYLLYPEILHWEERATEWSGKPDRIEIKLTLFSVENATVLHSTIISGKSRWASLGGDHPQDLLPKPLKSYISSLY